MRIDEPQTPKSDAGALQARTLRELVPALASLVYLFWGIGVLERIEHAVTRAGAPGQAVSESPHIGVAWCITAAITGLFAAGSRAFGPRALRRRTA